MSDVGDVMDMLSMVRQSQDGPRASGRTLALIVGIQHFLSNPGQRQYVGLVAANMAIATNIARQFNLPHNIPPLSLGSHDAWRGTGKPLFFDHTAIQAMANDAIRVIASQQAQIDFLKERLDEIDPGWNSLFRKKEMDRVD